jgi:hypothetical protein
VYNDASKVEWKVYFEHVDGTDPARPREYLDFHLCTPEDYDAFNDPLENVAPLLETYK